MIHLLWDPVAREALLDFFRCCRKKEGKKKVKHSLTDLFEQSLSFEILYTALNSITR
jgi:hypothetical protein